jgi:transposase-like protein
MWGIYNYGQTFLEDYWDYEKNNELGIDPWNIAINYSKKVWIKCQIKEYHDSYLTIANNFTSKNVRCPQCKGYNIHPLDSLGSKYPDSLLFWSDKNNKSPFEYASRTEQEVYWCCENGIHEDYLRRIDNSVLRNFRCPECYGKFKKTQEEFEKEIYELVGDEYLVLSKYNNNQTKVLFKHNLSECGNEFLMQPSNFFYGEQRCPACKQSKGEKRIREWLISKNINLEPQMKYEELLGIGGKRLSYDFYLPIYNILIEYQGEQHEKFTECFHKTEDDFKRQIEHDKRKRNYANKNKIELLEIWYWDFGRVEDVLNDYLNIK